MLEWARVPSSQMPLLAPKTEGEHTGRRQLSQTELERVVQEHTDTSQTAVFTPKSEPANDRRNTLSDYTAVVFANQHCPWGARCGQSPTMPLA